MNEALNDCIADFHDRVRDHFESVGITFSGNYPRCVPQDNVYLFYMDNLFKLLKIYKGIDLMDDYNDNPIKYHTFLFVRFERILYDIMKKHDIKEFTINFKDYYPSNKDVWELVLTNGLMVGKLYTKYQKK